MFCPILRVPRLIAQTRHFAKTPRWWGVRCKPIFALCRLGALKLTRWVNGGRGNGRGDGQGKDPPDGGTASRHPVGPILRSGLAYLAGELTHKGKYSMPF